MEKQFKVTITGSSKAGNFYGHLAHAGVNFTVESHTPSKQGNFTVKDSKSKIAAVDCKIIPLDDTRLKQAEFEIYTCNPETGEGGWDIRFVTVLGITSWAEARAKLKESYPQFDCVILGNYICEMEDFNYAKFHLGAKFLTAEYYDATKDKRIPEWFEF